MSLTIATWNIAGARPIRTKGIFDYAEEDIDYFVQELGKINPDIVCLQEVHLNAKRSVAKEIAEKLGNYFLHETVISKSHIDNGYHLGNAILSKENPTSYESQTFPYPEFALFLPNGVPAEHHDKAFQFADFSFGSMINFQMMPIKFLGTPYESEDGTKFALEMEDSLLKHSKNPKFICGDFNTKDATLLYRRLLDGMHSALPDKPTRPSEQKSDYIFYSNNYVLLDSRVVETNTDHYLCWAKFK